MSIAGGNVWRKIKVKNGPRILSVKGLDTRKMFHWYLPPNLCTLCLACEQAPKWGIGRRQKYRAIFLFALYPTWEPVDKLPSAMLIHHLLSILFWIDVFRSLTLAWISLFKFYHSSPRLPAR